MWLLLRQRRRRRLTVSRRRRVTWQFAREREMQRNMESYGYRRNTTTATVPSMDDARHHQQQVAAGAFDGAALASTDVQLGAGDREWRLSSNAAMRGRAAAGGMSCLY